MIGRPLTVAFSTAQRERFTSTALMLEWRRRYPALFDEDDERLAKSQTGHHFFEWLGAVIMHEATGYRCLLQKYQFKTHPAKQEVLRRIAPTALRRLLETRANGRFGMMQRPDLLMYSDDERDFFFCEVKGLNDRLSKRQVAFFGVIAEVTGKPVRLLEFKALEE